MVIHELVSVAIMNEESRRKVTDDLWKSGFGSELKAIKAFSDREGWGAVTASSFFDPVMKVSRELDFTAHKHRFRRKGEQGDFQFYVTASLIGEVKKSERPWAVLRTTSWKTPELPFLMNAMISSTIASLDSEIRTAFAKGCLISANKWFGHGVHEVFKRPDDHGRWFSAAAKTGRAALAATKRPQLKMMGDPCVVQYVQPLVVLDGPLLAVALDENSQMLVEEISYASVWVEEREAEIAQVFVVDLVTLAALPSYIDRIDTGFDECFKLLGKRITPTGASADLIDPDDLA
jgi:hypothetical protein